MPYSLMSAGMAQTANGLKGKPFIFLLHVMENAELCEYVCYGDDMLYRPPFMPERREGQPWLWYTYEQEHYFKLMQNQGYMQLFDYKVPHF